MASIQGLALQFCEVFVDLVFTLRNDPLKSFVIAVHD